MTHTYKHILILSVMCVTLILNEQFTDTEIYLTEFHNVFLKRLLIEMVKLNKSYPPQTHREITLERLRVN